MQKRLYILAVILLTSMSICLSTAFSNDKIIDVSYSQLTPAAKKQVDCLADNIYHEAGSEPFEGKVAVAQVTLNRVASGKFSNDICKVVYQKNVILDKVVCQFSWYCDTPARAVYLNKNRFEESEAVAKKVLLEGFRMDSLKEALYYHADYVNPKWNKERIAKIGQHIFYKDRGGL